MNKFAKRLVVAIATVGGAAALQWLLKESEKSAKNTQPVNSNQTPSSDNASDTITVQSRIVLPPEAFEGIEDDPLSLPNIPSTNGSSNGNGRHDDDLTELEGVDDMLRDALRELGIHRFIDLASVQAEELHARLNDVPLPVIQQWIAAARERLERR